MPFLQLKLVSNIEIGQSSNFSFSQHGGSIGRSNDCDWTLLDVDRYISNKHAQISYQNEQFILTDISSNGVIINNANAPLGKQNTHILRQSDRIKIGRYEIEVERLETLDIPQNVMNSSSQESDSDLLGLVMGDATSSADNNEADFLHIPQSASEEELGLSDILTAPTSDYVKPAQNIPSPSSVAPSTFDRKPEETPSFNEPKKAVDSNPHYVANDPSIPEDWELSGILPAIPDYEPPKSSTTIPETEEVKQEPLAVEPQTFEQAEIVVEIEDKILEPSIEAKVETPVEPKVETPTPIVSKDELPQVDAVKSAIETPVPKPAPEQPIVSDIPNEGKVTKHRQEGSDKFLQILYNKLGLPKEYLDSIDEEAFADDIATVMLSSTKGLMSLLNSRTAFKQESRLSLTSVQPRSNNPIKFSIDPVDTLEMLLLKKKKGYLTAKESYDEAVDDIQLHQMAFLSGLQATLVGVLGQLSPEKIESQINEKGRSFLGVKAKSQYWELYKDKQELLSKSVNENLNEVLSTYFSEAYQAQINNFKNDK